MAWAVPETERAKVNAAAKVFTNPNSELGDVSDALVIVNNWRASHSFPLNTFQNGLRARGRKIGLDILVAQWIKRLSSISLKLCLRPSMKLTQMQDIGGCRAILNTVDEVRQLVKSYDRSELRHKRLTTDDYIANPRISGYRGIHLVYSYYSDRKDTYNGLKIEIQIRSQMQHAWATAVEVVGTMINQSLKSSLGDGEWLRFFQLMSSEIARLEGENAIPGTPETQSDTKRELDAFVKVHKPVKRLTAYRTALRFFERATVSDHYFLLVLKPTENLLEVETFKRSESKVASDKYLEVEKLLAKDVGDEAVLVSVDSVAALRKAYPNFFLDTQTFTELVDRSVSRSA